MLSCYSVTAKLEELEALGEGAIEDVNAIKVQWITFEFGGLFEWFCLVSSVTCCFLLHIVQIRRLG